MTKSCNRGKATASRNDHVIVRADGAVLGLSEEEVLPGGALRNRRSSNGYTYYLIRHDGHLYLLGCSRHTPQVSLAASMPFNLSEAVPLLCIAAAFIHAVDTASSSSTSFVSEKESYICGYTRGR